MKHLLIYLCIVTFLSCTKHTATENGTVEYFKENITASMSYNELVEIFGEPEKDNGRGIHIYVYPLKDSTMIWIGYTDSIVYVRHMGKDGNLLDIIL